MSINFFEVACQEPARNDALFGICDDQNGNVAYTNADMPANWIATVENSNQIDVTFTAIDNCVDIFRDNGEMENRCDGMLMYTDNIIFVELKDQLKNWIATAINQVDVTIKYFIANNDFNAIRHKRAFVANKKHPHFNYGNPERSQQFFSHYRVRLNIEAKIVIK